MTELKSKEDVEALINKEGIEYVSVRFTDLIGVQQHFTVPASEFLKDAFTDGMPFDGSSVQGFQAINESDMKLVPDVETSFVDPFRKHKTLDVAFSIVDPLTDEPYSRDPRQKGYFPVPPIDHTQDLRDDMVANLQKVGLILERSHHEVAGAGQQEINYRFNTLQHAGDDLMKYKYVVHETAALAGKAATFMPKPIADDNGTGMHCHQSLWKDGKPLFYDEKGYAGLSDLARWYIGGLIKHSSSVLAFTNPSLNSYHRLVPGFEAPVNLVYSARNRSAAIRIPLAGTSPAAKRIEFRAPDPSCNPFLAFSAQLMAGLDGILNHIEPPEPVDKDLYELPPEEHAGIKQVPSSLAEAMDALEEDHDFLTAGDVFTDDLIETWIGLKRDEIDQARLAPTPLEYELYFHI